MKDHPWFKNFNWESVINQTEEPIYLPANNMKDNIDPKNIELEYDDKAQLDEAKRELKKTSVQS